MRLYEEPNIKKLSTNSVANMAVSGRKLRGFKDSTFIDSIEYYNICCEPCTFLGNPVEAKEFCVNCQENLCKRCADYHKSRKASRHHNLIDQKQKVTGGSTTAFDDSKICTEYCNIHKKEVIKFFCSRHDKVGCGDCMTLDHRTCNIDYIPDICSGIFKSKEFSGTLQNVSKTLKEVKSTKGKAQSKKTENKISVEGVIKEIEKFQKKIEQLKEKLVAEANSHRTNQEQKVDKISDSCARVYSELKQVYVALTDCQSKQFDAQAFIKMKQAQWILNSTHDQAFKQELADVSTTISFETNKELENMLSEQYRLSRIIRCLANVKKNKPDVDIGKSADAGVTITKASTTVLPCIKQKKTTKVRTTSDMLPCDISGCAVISADRLLLADWGNYKLKIVNTDTHSVVEEMSVHACPRDVTVLPRDQVAVTLPDIQKILILGTTGKLTRISNMNVGRRGWGIDYHHDHLYVVCHQPNSLLIIDLQGKVQSDIPLQTIRDQTFSKPLYIAIGKDGQTLYISDWESDFVASLTLQGSITGLYKHSKLNKPRGLVVLEDGSLLVCCSYSNTIHHISANLKHGRPMITDRLQNVLSICCHLGKRQICVGTLGGKLSIFSYE